MNKRILAAFLMLSMLFLTGCQLAKPEESTAVTDRLAGVLVTTEHLDLLDVEAYLNDNGSNIFAGKALEGNLEDYQQRLYGELTPTGKRMGDGAMEYEVSFPVEGWFEVNLRCSASGTWAPDDDYYWWSTNNGGFYDSRLENKVTDDGRENNMELSLAFAREGQVTLYANPIYQSPDGRVYVKSTFGGISADLSDGGTISQTLNSTVTTTADGKSESDTTNITVHASYTQPTESLVLLEMDENNQILQETTYKKGKIPKEVTLNRAAAYLIVQTTDGQKTERNLYNMEDKTVQYFTAQNDLAMPDYIQLHWSE